MLIRKQEPCCAAGKPRYANVNFYRYGVYRQLFSFDTMAVTWPRLCAEMLVR